MGIKFAINERFFDCWSNEMAYVLGYFYADGHLTYVPHIRGKYACLTSTDRDRIECFKRLLASDHTIYERIKGGNHKTIYQVRFGSKVIYDQLVSLGLSVRKASTMCLPRIPNTFFPAFVRGYFDGDGCVFLERSPNGNAKKLLSIFTSSSADFLNDLHSNLVKIIGIEGTRLYHHGSSNAFQLRYSTRNSLRLYALMYGAEPEEGMYLERKYAIFTQYLQERRLLIEDIPEIVQTKGPVVNRKHDGLQNRYSAGSTPAWASIKS